VFRAHRARSARTFKAHKARTVAHYKAHAKKALRHRRTLARPWKPPRPGTARAYHSLLHVPSGRNARTVRPGGKPKPYKSQLKGVPAGWKPRRQRRR